METSAIEQFVDEARIMGSLDHPNILPVYDLSFDPDDGRPQLLMKLVEGSTLSDLLHETAAPPAGARLERLLGVVLKVCDAVSFAHSRGVVHRDLHPRERHGRKPRTGVRHGLGPRRSPRAVAGSCVTSAGVRGG